MKIIVISGSPGTGKSEISKKILDLINSKLLSLNELIISKNFILKHDDKRETQVADFKKLIPFILDTIKIYRKEEVQVLVIESHFSDIVPNKYIDCAFVLRCEPHILYERLKNRGYKEEKIRENVQAEILASCTSYFIQKKFKGPLLEIDTSHENSDHIAKVIIDIIEYNKDVEKYKFGKIDWLEKLFQEDNISDFFD